MVTYDIAQVTTDKFVIAREDFEDDDLSHDYLTIGTASGMAITLGSDYSQGAATYNGAVQLRLVSTDSAHFYVACANNADSYIGVNYCMVAGTVITVGAFQPITDPYEVTSYYVWSFLPGIIVTSPGKVASCFTYDFDENAYVYIDTAPVPYIRPAVFAEVLKFQPNTIINGTTLPDRDTADGIQNGTITWGTNPSGTSVETSGFQPTNPAQYGIGGYAAYTSGTAGTILSGSVTAPPQLYTELDTSKIPGGAAIDAILNAGDTPKALWWFPFIYIGAIIIGMLVYDATQREGGQGSLLAMCATILILQVLFGVLGTVGVSGMIPLWTAILFIIPAGALMMARKHVGWG